MAPSAGESMWATFEAEGLLVDDELKCILKAAKCDNLLILSSFNKDDRVKLESFMTETLHKIISRENYHKYYGIYEEQPSLFKFVAGQEKQLDLIIKMSKRLIDAANLASRAPNADNQERSQRSPNTGSALNLATKVCAQGPTKPSAADQKVVLDKNINDHLKTTYEGDFTVSANVSEDGLDSFIASVVCPICDSVKKITKTGTRWNTSNFYAHLRIHIAKDENDPKLRKISDIFKRDSSSGSSSEGSRAHETQRSIQFLTLLRSSSQKRKARTARSTLDEEDEDGNLIEVEDSPEKIQDEANEEVVDKVASAEVGTGNNSTASDKIFQ